MVAYEQHHHILSDQNDLHNDCADQYAPLAFLQPNSGCWKGAQQDDPPQLAPTQSLACSGLCNWDNKEMMYQLVESVPQSTHQLGPLELAVQQWVDHKLCSMRSGLTTPCNPTRTPGGPPAKKMGSVKWIKDQNNISHIWEVASA